MFAIDIDGTIAGGGTQGLLDHFREVLRLPLLDIPEDIRWEEVFELPEILAYRKAHPRRYRTVRDNVMESLLVLRSCPPMPGSIEQVGRLAQIAPLHYVTARGNDLPSQETTKHWLTVSGYPSPDAVTFCPSFEHKLFAVMRLPADRVILIDDRAHEIARALYTLKTRIGNDPRGAHMLDQARQKLTLVFFGQTYIHETSTFPGVQMIALPSWECIDDVCGELIQEFAMQGA